MNYPHVPQDLYGKEAYESGCENVYAMKLFKGTKNPRMYCQQYSDTGKKIFVVVVSELLQKKKSQRLTHKEKAIIRRVSNYQYELHDG